MTITKEPRPDRRIKSAWAWPPNDHVDVTTTLMEMLGSFVPEGEPDERIARVGDRILRIEGMERHPLGGDVRLHMCCPCSSGRQRSGSDLSLGG